MGTETAFEIVRLPREGQASLASRAFSSVLTHSSVCVCVLKRSGIQVNGCLLFHSLNRVEAASFISVFYVKKSKLGEFKGSPSCKGGT